MNATRKTYEAPALSVSGRFVAETRKFSDGGPEPIDVNRLIGAGSIGFGL